MDKPRCQARARCPKDSLARVPLRQRMLSSGSKPSGGFSIPERSRRFVFGSSEETLRRASKLDPKANERGVVRFAALDGSAVFHDWDTQRPSPVKTSFCKSQTILRSILGGANIALAFILPCNLVGEMPQTPERFQRNRLRSYGAELSIEDAN